MSAANEARLQTTMKVLRAQQGLTQAHLAELSGITRKSINAIEMGHMVPSTILALRLAHALGVTVEQLFQLATDAVPPKENEMKTLLTLAVCLVAPLAFAQTMEPSLRALALARVESGAVPALVVATIDGTKQQVNGFGRIGGPSSAVPDADTVFEIGSVTKTFTALLLADAVARGEVTLDEPVAKLLPGFTVPTYQGKPITLLDLATQSSGLPRLPDNLLPRNGDNPYADYGSAQLKTFLARYTLPRAPGTSYEYSNLGVGLLGFALANRAQMSYDALVRTRITGPLQMLDTGVLPRVPANLAPGHGHMGQQVPGWDFDALAGAGALRSTAHDLLRYLAALMHTPPATTPQGLHTVWQPLRPTAGTRDRIALAWHVRTEQGRTIVWHNGMTGGYASFIGFTADGQHAVVVLGNAMVSVDDIGMRALLPPAPVDAASISAATSAVLAQSAAMAGSATPAAPAAPLTDYLGRYELAPGFVLTIKREQDALYAQVTGQGTAPIFPRKRDEFFYKVVDASLQFERNAAGAVTAVTLHQGGRDTRAARIGDLLPTPAAPAAVTLPVSLQREYVGSYQIAPAFRLALTEENGQLYGQATAQPRLSLSASARDELFNAAIGIGITMTRNAAGVVTGLVLHQNGRDIAAPRVAD